MSTDITEPVQETKPTITDELREKASRRPLFNILFVSDGDSNLRPFRGEPVVDTFSQFYSKFADITVTKTSGKVLGEMGVDEFSHYNILWLDNLRNTNAIRTVTNLQTQLLSRIDPNWGETVAAGGDGLEAYLKGLTAKKTEVLNVIYALDEFVWEAPAGRSVDLQTAKNVEAFLNMSDSVVVPTYELKDAIVDFRFVKDASKPVAVIPTSASDSFFPLYRSFSRGVKSMVDSALDKPRILVKGLTIPANVQAFIAEQYKKYEITVCSVGELDDHIMGLIHAKKVSYVHHWANPQVTASTVVPTYAIERDGGYNFAIHCKPNSLAGNFYEMCLGDEDILFSIASGALPVNGVSHVGYGEDSMYIGVRCGIQFDKDTTSKTINEEIRNHMVPVKFNEAMGKCRQVVDSRITLSPMVMGLYFSLFLGRELSQARSLLAEEGANADAAKESIGVQGVQG